MGQPGHKHKAAAIMKQRGMTLIEISIVILLMALFVGMVVPSVSNITRADLRSTSRKLAGAIRYTYDLAVRKDAVFRVVMDLDDGSFWVESSTDRFLLGREKTKVEDGALAEEDEDKERHFVSRSYIESGDMWKPKKKATFSNFAGPLTKKVTLPKTVSFQDVWVFHQEERVTTGQAYIYCFPSGMSEKAIIHLVDEDENAYTLWVQPLTGRVRIYPEFVEAPDE